MIYLNLLMKLKISLLILFTLLTSSDFYAQSGYAYYQKQLASSEEEIDNKYMKQALEQLKAQEYELSFNKNIALFKEVEALSTETNPVVEAFTESLSGFTGEVYFDNVKKAIIHKKAFSGNIFLIYKKDINWKLTSETLQIDNFLCYKATTVQTIKNSAGTHEFEITAWYAPEISLPYGPDGFGGLPGLILQLENNGTLTSIKRLKFLDNKSIEIDIPSKGQKITEEEFNALVSKTFENRKN